MSAFRKSSFSASESACVELAVAPMTTRVRDTKARGAGTVEFSADSFAAFVARLKNG